MEREISLDPPRREYDFDAEAARDNDSDVSTEPPHPVQALLATAFSTVSQCQPHMLGSQEMRSFLETVIQRAYSEGVIATLTDERDRLRGRP